MNHVIQLIEYETCFFAPNELSEDDARRIYIHFGDKVSVEWPTPKTDGRWQLTSLGWVGFIPIGQKSGISLKPKVPLQNLFKMLEYAYDMESLKLSEGSYDCKSIRDFYERLAKILADRLIDRAKEGLYKTYKEEYEDLSFVRGRIDILALARTPVKTQLPCYFENYTIDIEDNQIIAWTLHTILRSCICTDRSIPVLRKAERILRNSVALSPYNGCDCVGRVYDRLNADYEIIHKLCRFFLDNIGPTQDLGDRTMVPFLVDMARLFQLFVARWLNQNLDVRYLLKWQETFVIGEKGALRMVMDLIIYNRENGVPLCILDTKYKAHSSVSSEDYSQVVAYSDAVGCENAILIFPKKLDQPFNEKPGRIRVKTAVFDLGVEIEKAGELFLKNLYETI